MHRSTAFSLPELGVDKKDTSCRKPMIEHPRCGAALFEHGRVEALS
jgi:hypothetical protein